MVLLGIPPLARRQDLRRDRAASPPFFLHLLRDLLRRLLLLLVVIEDGAAVLRAGIGPLSVFRGGVVHLVEKLEQLSVGDLIWVEDHLEGFSVCKSTTRSV